MVLGMCIATVGIFTTAFSASVRARLQRVVRALPARPARKIGELARWFEQTYGPCPPGIRILAWVQLLVIGMYVLLDLLPRLHGGVGAGYSVLFGIIPFSYLLLYSTIEGQKQGETMLRIIVVLVLAIQLPNQLWRFLTDTYGHAATVLDMVSIVVLLGGTLCGGIMIAFRQRGHTSALAASIDYLFHQETQATFWTHLTSEVGRVVGVSTWMWVIRQQPESWHLLEHTARARREWLEAPGVQAGLARLAALQPLSVVVDTTELPTTLLLLPIAREHMVYEVIIAANPQHVRGGKQLLDANLLSRLRDAVNALRFRERQQALAREQERLAVAYRRLHLQEQEEAGVAYIQAYALLHDGPLQQSSHLVGRLRTLAHELDTAQAARLLALVDDLRDIDTTTRAIFQDMGTLLVVEQLGVYVQERIREWEQQHPTITFMDETDDDEPPLTQVQRNQLALIIKQAVTNAIQHAQASRICISIRHRDGHLILTVSDDGQGFAAHHGTRQAAQVSPAPMQHVSTGLVVMRDLAHLLGARCAIESQPGAGCRVVVDMPLDGHQGTFCHQGQSSKFHPFLMG
jgi:signal transduction histidine kinase